MKSYLTIGLLLNMGLLFSGCTTPDNKNLTVGERCTGLQREMAMSRNSNSYAPETAQQQYEALRQQYLALKCDQL